MKTSSIISGFTDEVSDELDVQIRALKELGWSHIDLRTVDGKNVSTLSDEEFARVHRKLEENDIAIACFGSTVANWGRDVISDLERDLEELRTSIRHMHTAGVPYIRIMSYKVSEPEPLGTPMEAQVISSIKKITEIAEDNGVVCLHENCLTWGGQSHQHCLRLLEAVDSPALRLVYDTGNPVSMKDVSGTDPYYYQDSYLFFEQVKEFVDYIHIKDAVVENDEPRYVFPGEGGGRVKEILKSAAEERPGLPISIEPHMAVVFHDPSVQAPLEERWSTFIRYGKQALRVAEEAGIRFS
ncbi:MAG: sugar phosphate isomerase/epimerase [Desulfofustis sp.]|nr:sugar phosphate isomerase/epimerase [Desulfofustis sp.]